MLSSSLKSRGLWWEMLCFMHEGNPRGFLTTATGKAITLEQLGRLVGETADEVSILLQELEDNGVFSRTAEGVIYSRRMVRDESKRNKCSEAGKRGGNPTLMGRVKGEAKGEAKPKQIPSSSVSNTEEAVFKFGLKDGTAWGLTAAKLAEYRETFQAIDVAAELRLILQWRLDNPTKRKTAKGMPTFLTAWLARKTNPPAVKAATESPSAWSAVTVEMLRTNNLLMAWFDRQPVIDRTEENRVWCVAAAERAIDHEVKATNSASLFVSLAKDLARGDRSKLTDPQYDRAKVRLRTWRAAQNVTTSSGRRTERIDPAASELAGGAVRSWWRDARRRTD